MADIVIRKIEGDRAGDARLPNQPFQIWGRLIPSLENGVWRYTAKRLDAPAETCYPDEPYDPARDDALFLGAYDGERCVGLAVYRKDMFRYLYLDDLKVNADRRGQGIGGLLVQSGLRAAREMGLKGVYAIAQDKNLSACLFYLKQGFAIGGFDNRCYDGTSQEGQGNVFFYLDA